MSTEEGQVSAEDMPDAAAEAAEAPSAEMADDTDMGDAETPGEPQRPRQFGQNEPRGPDYRAFTPRFDETVAAEDLCEPEELERLRAISTSNWRICRAWSPASPTACSAA